MSIKEISLAFVSALGVAVFLTPLARLLALKLDLVDDPEGRKQHLMSTPLLGGAAIYLAFASVVLTGLLLFSDTQSVIPLSWQTLCLMVIAGGGLMAVAGLVDDIMCLKPSVKLLLHTIAAVAVGVVFITKGALLSIFLNQSSFAWLTIPLTVLWLVGITNAVNLLDHADGLSAGTCAVAAGYFTIINFIFGNYSVAFVSAALAGASAGFFFFNHNPASIFMGDCGSNMLGFMLGIIAVLGVYTPEGSMREIAIFTPVLILALPMIDTAFVIRYRWKHGKPLFGADRNHLAHRLMRLGLSHRQAVNIMLFLGFLMGILALLLPTLKPYQAILLFIHALGLVAMLAFFINHAETRE